ncbi:MAG: hypothetical protein NTU53_00680, partial [Planctomycetota bacterium]|nr:hypothetical protein [Planctomycetota bacterium]
MLAVEAIGVRLLIDTLCGKVSLSVLVGVLKISSGRAMKQVTTISAAMPVSAGVLLRPHRMPARIVRWVFCVFAIWVFHVAACPAHAASVVWGAINGFTVDRFTLTGTYIDSLPIGYVTALKVVGDEVWASTPQSGNAI